MPLDAGADEAFELKLIFFRELGQGYPAARAALDRLGQGHGNAEALAELRAFFHRIAGVAESVELGLLGRLAAACEGAAEAIHEGTMQPSARSTRIFADGLAGVATVLEGAQPPVEQSGGTQLQLFESTTSKILIVDDDPVSARLIDGVLRAAGFASSYLCDPQKALARIEAEAPDLIVMDVVMPGLDGFELCGRIRRNAAFQLTPIVFVTRKGDVEQRVRGLEVGGNDYLKKPFAPQELVARIRSQLQRLEQLREMASRDGLTRCYNHEYFKTRLEQELPRARRSGTPLTLGLLDIDHFKQVNDSYGHPAGDAVLARLASILQASVRSSDVVARYGGEEFGFLLIDAGVAEAERITNRLRERIARHSFELPKPLGSARCTVSIGIAPLRPEDTVAALVQRADEALYAAKHGGRNLVRVAG